MHNNSFLIQLGICAEQQNPQNTTTTTWQMVNFDNVTGALTKIGAPITVQGEAHPPLVDGANIVSLVMKETKGSGSRITGTTSASHTGSHTSSTSVGFNLKGFPGF